MDSKEQKQEGGALRSPVETFTASPGPDALQQARSVGAAICNLVGDDFFSAGAWTESKAAASTDEKTAAAKSVEWAKKRTAKNPQHPNLPDTTLWSNGKGRVRVEFHLALQDASVLAMAMRESAFDEGAQLAGQVAEWRAHRLSPFEEVLYYVAKMPFPHANRDFLLAGRIGLLSDASVAMLYQDLEPDDLLTRPSWPSADEARFATLRDDKPIGERINATPKSRASRGHVIRSAFHVQRVPVPAPEHPVEFKSETPKHALRVRREVHLQLGLTCVPDSESRLTTQLVADIRRLNDFVQHNELEQVGGAGLTDPLKLKAPGEGLKAPAARAITERLNYTEYQTIRSAQLQQLPDLPNL